jgi:hypothetical protein
MKKNLLPFVLLTLFVFTHNVSLAQENEETVIKNLEDTEGQAWVKKDSTTLFKLFSPQIVVNTPLNKVATLDIIKRLMRAGKIDLSSSKKVIEKITFINDMAVVMGQDIIQPRGAMENAGKTVTRRYTDVWIKKDSSWVLIIRQATIISII